MTIIVFALPLHKRPKYQGFFGAVFGVASVAGPLVAGAFTTKVTWRWCFYINLPLGGVVMAVIFLLLEIPNRPNTQKALEEKLRQLNGLGILAILPGIVCLCLALQWGGTKYAVSFFHSGDAYRVILTPLVERGSHRRTAGVGFCTSDRVRLDPGVETRAGDAAAAHLPPTEHRLRLLGQLLSRLTYHLVR
jgi:MFS family permease